MESASAKQRFTEWLSARPSLKYPVDKIVKSLDEASRYAIQKHLTPVTFWRIQSRAGFTDIVLKVKSQKLFQLLHNSSYFALFDNATRLYEEFLVENSRSHAQTLHNVANDFFTDSDSKGQESHSNSVKEPEDNTVRVASDSTIERPTLMPASVSDLQQINNSKSSSLDEGEAEIADAAENEDIAQLNENAQVEAPSQQLGSSEVNASITAEIHIDEKNVVPEPSYTDSLTAADRLYVVLKRESMRNQYGTTLYYLASRAKVSEDKARTILAHSEWAKLKYGRYFYIDVTTEGILKFDFYHPKSLTYTKPVSLSYFDEIISNANSWRKLYVDFIKVLYEDYPDYFQKIAGMPEVPAELPLIVNEEGAKDLRKPVKFADGLYIELNRSAVSIVKQIKKLLDICNVDYENVVISYKHKDEESEKQTESAETEKPLRQQTKEENTSRSESISVSKTGEGQTSKSCDHHSESEVLQLLVGDEFEPLCNALEKQGITTIEKLKDIKLWPFMNRNNLYSIAMRQRILTKVNKLLYPVSDTDGVKTYILSKDDKEYKGSTPSEAFLQFCEDMLRYYPLQIRSLVGVRPYGSFVPVLIREQGENCLKMPSLSVYIRGALSKEDVVRFAAWICGKCGENNTDISISEYDPTNQPENNNYRQADTTAVEIPAKHAVLYEAVSDHNADSEIQSSHRANSCFTSSDRTNSNAMFLANMEAYLKKADIAGASYDELKDFLQWSMVATKQHVLEDSNVVDIRGRLYHKDALVDWDEGAKVLDKILDRLMHNNNGYASASQLYEYARVDMNMFLNDNDMNDERSVYDMARQLFEKEGYNGKHYKFTGNEHISRIDEAITSNMDLFKKYAEDQGGVFAFDSLVEYLESVGVGTGNLRAQMKIPSEPIFFYYEKGVLMYSGSMHIDDEWKAEMKDALNTLLSDVDGHIILHNLPRIWLDQLPQLPGRWPWTPLLLQSLLRCYDKQLGARTIPALESQSLDTLHAMLVSKDSPIQNFGDVVVSYLVENDIAQRDFEAEELRRMLVSAEIIQGNELIWNMPKALNNDARFAWDASGSRVRIEV